MMFSEEDIRAQQQARDAMIAKHIVPRGVQDPRVIDAMRRTPRHLFVPAEKKDDAYLDHPLPISCKQTISQPYIVAAMTEMLQLTPEAHVLEVGTGSGYQTAVLATIAKQVTSVERHADLAETARQRLDGLGYGNVHIVIGDGTCGYAAAAPYEAILVTAATPDIPEPLQTQLAVGGRLVAPVGSKDVQHLVTLVREDSATFTRHVGFACRFVPLIGEQGWRDERGD